MDLGEPKRYESTTLIKGLLTCKGETLRNKNLLTMYHKGGHDIRNGSEVNTIILNSWKLSHMNMRVKFFEEIFRYFSTHI